MVVLKQSHSYYYTWKGHESTSKSNLCYGGTDSSVHVNSSHKLRILLIRGLCSNPRSTLMLASGSAQLGVKRRHEPKSYMDNVGLYFNQREYS